jgi:hypothetical protein
MTEFYSEPAGRENLVTVEYSVFRGVRHGIARAIMLFDYRWIQDRAGQRSLRSNQAGGSRLSDRPPPEFIAGFSP